MRRALDVTCDSALPNQIREVTCDSLGGEILSVRERRRRAGHTLNGPSVFVLPRDRRHRPKGETARRFRCNLTRAVAFVGIAVVDCQAVIDSDRTNDTAGTPPALATRNPPTPTIRALSSTDRPAMSFGSFGRSLQNGPVGISVIDDLSMGFLWN